MKSRIILKESVDNYDRKFGAALKYYPATIVSDDGSESYALFTKDQIGMAIARAERNTEDIQSRKTIWQLFFGD